MGAPFRRKRSWGIAALAVGVMAGHISAASITFDPDGAAPANPPQTINGLDWAVGNTLATGINPLTVGATFQQYYQATLAGVINPQGFTVAPTGLNSNFEITAVMSATQLVTSVSTLGGSTSVTYQLAPVQSANSFFEIWYDPGRDANNLTGTGFNNGTRIYVGGPNPAKVSLGNYAASTAIELFDQFGADNYGGKQSVVGTGGLTDDNTVAARDASFFITDIASMAFNTSKVTPFKEVDPSQLFAGVAGGAPPAIVPIIGNPVGFSSDAPDIQFQSDANVTFTPVPEPGGMLLATGWALTAAAMRRRRRGS
jgi:hypothetical protein